MRFAVWLPLGVFGIIIFITVMIGIIILIIIIIRGSGFGSTWAASPPPLWCAVVRVAHQEVS